MFYGKFGDEEDNLVDNSNIFNLEGDNRLLTGLIWHQSGSVIVYYNTWNYFIVFFKTKFL